MANASRWGRQVGEASPRTTVVDARAAVRAGCRGSLKTMPNTFSSMWVGGVRASGSAHSPGTPDEAEKVITWRQIFLLAVGQVRGPTVTQ
jgi:hypothetical protein